MRYGPKTLLCIASLVCLQTLTAQTHKRFDPTAQAKSGGCAASLAACPVSGCGGGDKLLDTKKNQQATPADYAAMSFDDFRHLEEERPTTWKQGQNRSEVEQLGEGSAVMLAGYLFGAHSGSVETVNCKLSGEANNDYHINIVENDGDPQTASVVVEMTPKMRPGNHGWDLKTLRAIPAAPGKQHAFVRVSGYLLFDSEHVTRSGGERMTIREIHPVTKFEVCAAGNCAVDNDAGWQDITKNR
jgi:hypothetical protein